MPRTSFAALLVALPLVASCSAGADGQRDSELWTKPGSKVSQTSGLLVEQFFPMKDGEIYHYETTNEVGAKGLLVVRVRRDDHGRGTFLYPAGNKIFEYRPDGLFLVGKDKYVLRMPAEMGASWPGENGGTTHVVNTAAIVEVPAGRFDGCLQTLEDKGGVKYGTTFCPNVGVVLLEAASGASFERAALKSRGEVVNIGPDGVTKSVVNP